MHLGNSTEHQCRIILPTTNVYHVLGVLHYASVGCMTEAAEDANTTGVGGGNLYNMKNASNETPSTLKISYHTPPKFRFQ